MDNPTNEDPVFCILSYFVDIENIANVRLVCTMWRNYFDVSNPEKLPHAKWAIKERTTLEKLFHVVIPVDTNTTPRDLELEMNRFISSSRSRGVVFVSTGITTWNSFSSVVLSLMAHFACGSFSGFDTSK